ncbi:hypothetical protein J7337_010490 [Fusarium musae]|uniref:Uncharacterized protein n=2 Tax=Fusarium TaxID=5506 RepID=A0A9P8IL92_9HYPO|nr:hypothetical protein J7337_010490 [Fusarium musae]KAG9497629.1 hypothetical protein J7337_010490 [Fusarium musae]
MVNRGPGPDDRRDKDAQDGVAQEHASADVDMTSPEVDHTQETNIAESNTTRQISDINVRLEEHREDIKENNGMIAYIGNAQYYFEGMIDKFEDTINKHCSDCDRKLKKISRNLGDMSSTSQIKAARELHQNKGQDEMRKTNEALSSENARLKEQVEKQDAAIKQLTSTVTDLMGRFAKLESTVDCKEAERKLSELEV